ncbi:MAG: ABC transporter ATP-binding protein [Chlorobi bacterium]|nr:ABC transporter ATP-binding protein [Chlorobiota bacterium]MCI0715691.1 ABC transporter ATP-binding protein [Chlorobiota bacterium]
MPVIETQNLSKEYSSGFSKQKVNALNDFSFSVNEGEIFGLLGPNGAGKTTLIKILLAITFPTRGNAKIFGTDVRNHKAKAKVGYLPENHRFPNYLTGEQVLSFYGRLSGMKPNDAFKKRIDELLELMKLTQWKQTKIKKYSKGMMQKLGLAQSILSEPDLIFLDEPTDGVDPIGRKEIRDILIELKSKGKTIFLNSHLLSEVEMICDRVAILNKGDLVKEGNVDDLTKAENIFAIHTVEPLNIELKQKILAIDSNAGAGENEINTEAGVDNLNKIIDLLRKNKIRIQSVSQKTSTLEELFINVIKKDNIS